MRFFECAQPLTISKRYIRLLVGYKYSLLAESCNNYWKLRCRQCEFWVKFFLRFFLHHLIERELLITKNYLLALANTSFRSKNTKYSKDSDFFEKHIFCQNVPNFLLRSFFQLPKINFSDSASKTEYKKVVKSTLDLKLYWWWRFESRRVHYV